MAKDNGKIEINRPIADFVEALKKSVEREEKKELAESRPEEEEETAEASESMARLYEKVRNLIEYKDDHLIKRYAIERILKRNLLIEFRQGDFTDQFLAELAMAGYLERKAISEELKYEIGSLIAKYQAGVRNAPGYETKKWLVAVGSCEIEETLFPNPARYALTGAMYQTVQGRIKFSGRLPEKEKDIQIFIAVLRSLSKVDSISLNYYLAKIYLPEWFENSTAESKRIEKIKNISILMGSVRAKASSPLSAKISFALRKYAVYFNIIYEAAINNFAKLDRMFANPEALKFAVQLAADETYDREMRRFWKRVKRSLVFLVITKIILAVAVEYPYDLYIVGRVDFTPILINLLFPPLYLVFLSSTVKRPSEQNSALIAKGVEEIVYGNVEKPAAEIKLRDLETSSDKILYLFFILTFGISFGLATWLLLALNFNWLAILIFLFLFSVVSFFSALVRQPVRELLIAREREGVIGMIIDTFSIPFVRIGKWMSVNFSKINVFIFAFDVLIEAPFKVFVRFVQQWAGFIQRKKEEMI